jgi:ABC-2 type transport system permease protein
MTAGSLPVASSGPVRVALSTAVAYVRRTLAYTIEVVRWPLFPILFYATLILTYQAAGRQSVDGVSPESFLLVGIFGMTLWSTAIWSGGYAIELERDSGTINSLFLAPVSRDAIVIGYSLGAISVFVAPAMVIATLLGLVAGVEFNVSQAYAPLAAGIALMIAALAMAHLLAGAFVLTRRANMFANFLQAPIYVLSGMVVPIDNLPKALQWFAFIFPVSAGLDALRGTLLSGEPLGAVAGPIVRLLVISAVLFVAGHKILERVEDAARNAGTLDFE